jgi:hypothetical protein
MPSVPRIRIRSLDGACLLREGISLCFYVRHPHRDIAEGIRQSLDAYLEVVGRASLGWFFDTEGFAQPLDESEWARIWHELREQPDAFIHLLDESSREKRFGFEYSGKPLGSSYMEKSPQASCAVQFWLPTEYLDEQGPGPLRELALKLAEPLPLSLGLAGFAFKGSTSPVGILRKIREQCFRYPGMDIPELEHCSWHLGTRVRGPSWMTFLGEPVLGELGGADGLRARLSSPGTTVQSLSGERAVVTLGPAPDAGDLEQGNTLPAYRELARVLEPWLFQDEPIRCLDFPPEDRRRWERRFLD